MVVFKTFCCRSWKCQKPGHLAEDCLAMTSQGESSLSGKTHNQVVLSNVNEEFTVNLLLGNINLNV